MKTIKGFKGSRFAEVESKGETKDHTEDSKIATNKLHIGIELNLKQFIEAAAFGKDSVAVSTGCGAQAKATKGNWIVLAERNDDYTIKEVKATLVDGETIKVDTFYQLINGKFIEQ